MFVQTMIQNASTMFSFGFLLPFALESMQCTPIPPGKFWSWERGRRRGLGVEPPQTAKKEQNNREEGKARGLENRGQGGWVGGESGPQSRGLITDGEGNAGDQRGELLQCWDDCGKSSSGRSSTDRTH